MLIRRCAIVYIEQLIAHASDRGVTRRKFKQSLDAFKRLQYLLTDPFSRSSSKITQLM